MARNMEGNGGRQEEKNINGREGKGSNELSCSNHGSAAVKDCIPTGFTCDFSDMGLAYYEMCIASSLLQESEDNNRYSD